jgi:hypothetical protein
MRPLKQPSQRPWVAQERQEGGYCREMAKHAHSRWMVGAGLRSRFGPLASIYVSMLCNAGLAMAKADGWLFVRCSGKGHLEG